VLEAVADHRRLGRALLFSGWVAGARRGQHEVRRRAAEQALEHYRQSRWPIATCVGEIANALYLGPTPVPEAIARCEGFLAEEALNRYGNAVVHAYLGGLVAQRGDFNRARELIATARCTFDELGHRMALATQSGVVLGDVELLAEDAAAAETTFRWVCEELASRQAYSRLASRAGDLAEALYRQERFVEAEEWVDIGRKHSASDDVDALGLWMPVSAKIAAQRRGFDVAIESAVEAAALVEATDGLNRRAAVHGDLGEVLLLAGRAAEASDAFERAIELFERKGNTVGAARIRARLGDPVTA
jgi:tetratricopeptide (TPR) repeat protein